MGLPEAFLFERRTYSLAELPMVIPDGALRPIGQAEPIEGTKALADPTVYAAEGVDPTAAVFAAVDTGGGTSTIDVFVSGTGQRGEPLYPDGICRYVPLGQMPSGLPVACSPPWIIEVLGRRYADSYAWFELGPDDLEELGVFEVVDGQRPAELGTTAWRIIGAPPEDVLALVLGDQVLVYVREGLLEEHIQAFGEGVPVLPAILCDRLRDRSAGPWCG